MTSVIGLTGDPGNNDPACVRQDTPPTGTEHWDVRQNHTYRVRLEGVTECSGDTIQVHVFNPFRRVDDPGDCYEPQCLTATRVGDGIYEFDVTFSQLSSKTYYIRYCTSSDCSSGGFLARRSDGVNAPSLIRLAHFDPRTCEFIREDKLCIQRGPRLNKLDIGCYRPGPNDPEFPTPSRDEIIGLLKPYEDCDILEVVGDPRFGDPEPNPDRGPCWYRRFVEIDVIDCEFVFWTVGEYINWQRDDDPPYFEQFPEGGDLGCYPEAPQLPSCEDILVQVVARDDCDNPNSPEDDVNLECFEGEVEELSKCRFRKTYTIRATDKCGNYTERSVSYTWKVDGEPPTVNNVPTHTINLGCNPQELPSCAWLINTYGIEAKDNCVEEGNAPTLYCEAGEIEELSKCRYRQTFRFWAVDKSECGNRSQDYFVTVVWKVDTEPPTVNNVPTETINLGCNPPQLPSCDWLIATYGIEAKDNCVEEGNAPTLYCEPGEIEPLENCRYRQTFRFWAVDKSECGNQSAYYYVTVEWQIDNEPPVINNLPRGGKLPCNTRPTCEYLIQRYNIEAKDNCDKEPQLYCEPGELEQIEECQYRQTFRFWAVDKCGNRTRDYFVTFFWKEDTEPPMLHNLPPGGDLGCNPSQVPTCATFQGVVTATDNCTPNVQVFCFSNDLPLGCLFIRAFVFSAADECGNVTTRTVIYYWTVDNTPPVVRCPEDIVVQAPPKECFVEVNWRAKADDDCDPNPSLSCNPPSGSLFPLGTTVVTCTARDRCGNTATCSFRVIVLGHACGTKFHDRNGNGVRDPGEEGLAGWTIELVDAATNTVLQTVVTDENGRYCFLGLTSPGTYIIREVLQPGWINTTPRERRYVLPRDCGKQIDFGNRRTP